MAKELTAAILDDLKVTTVIHVIAYGRLGVADAVLILKYLLAHVVETMMHQGRTARWKLAFYRFR